MKADENSASPAVTLQVELKYALPDGKYVTLWKGSKVLVAVDLSVITALNEQQYKIAAKNTAELFTQFVNDILRIRAAQAKGK